MPWWTRRGRRVNGWRATTTTAADPGHPARGRQPGVRRRQCHRHGHDPVAGVGADRVRGIGGPGRRGERPPRHRGGAARRLAGGPLRSPRGECRLGHPLRPGGRQHPGGGDARPHRLPDDRGARGDRRHLRPRRLHGAPRHPAGRRRGRRPPGGPAERHPRRGLCRRLDDRARHRGSADRLRRCGAVVLGTVRPLPGRERVRRRDARGRRGTAGPRGGGR